MGRVLEQFAGSKHSRDGRLAKAPVLVCKQGRLSSGEIAIDYLPLLSTTGP